MVKSYTKDPLRSVDLPPLPGLPNCPQLEVPFESRPFKLNDLKMCLKKTKNSSKPGVNKIPYKVYKKCENLTKCLFLIIKCVQNSNYVPLKWRISDGVMIPKVDRPKENQIEDYRQIFLMNVEGKLFLSLVSKRLYNFVVDDNH